MQKVWFGCNRTEQSRDETRFHGNFVKLCPVEAAAAREEDLTYL
jgi:hypothetical protein